VDDFETLDPWLGGSGDALLEEIDDLLAAGGFAAGWIFVVDDAVG
jgi:hypothetical protein